VVQVDPARVMPMCALTPLLLIGFVAGTAVSSLTDSDLAGWVAALAAFALAVAVRRVRGTSTACAVNAPAHAAAKRHRDP
jgi:hypothetical protein